MTEVENISVSNPPVGGMGLRRHVPVRTCAGCGGRAPRAMMRRLALISGQVGVEWRDAGGRGTYLHDTAECRQRFVGGKKRLPGLRATVGRRDRQLLLEPEPANDRSPQAEPGTREGR